MSRDPRKMSPPGPPGAPHPAKRRAGGRAVDQAFDTWLQRELHQMYDQVAREPIPDDLLKLIDGDASKRS